MSTTPTEPTPAEPTAPTTEPGATSDPIKLPDDHPLVTAFATLKGEVKALKAERLDPEELKRLRAVDEASKTEAQKAAERLEAAEAKVKEYETREQIAAWKAEVATATGVPANVLAGSTKEEIEAHAETLKPLLGAAQQPTPPAVVPTIGRTPAELPNISLADQILAAETARNAAAVGSPEHAKATELVMELKAMQLFEASKTT